MAKQISYSKFEQQIRPELRQHLNISESTEDVKKFFVYAVCKLISSALENKVRLSYEDVKLQPDQSNGYMINDRLLDSEDFSLAWRNSDLPNIIGRLAEAAGNRYRNLEKNQGKAELKIFARS